jgi:hypothetical protein
LEEAMRLRNIGRSLALLTSAALALAVVSCASGDRHEVAGAPASGFVNRVWLAGDSTGVAAGSVYVFLSDGTLVMTGPGGRPAFGTWSPASGGLTMVEDGVAYPTDVVELTGERLYLRSHNPGSPVDIVLAPAPQPPFTR